MPIPRPGSDGDLESLADRRPWVPPSDDDERVRGHLVADAPARARGPGRESPVCHEHPRGRPADGDVDVGSPGFKEHERRHRPAAPLGPIRNGSPWNVRSPGSIPSEPSTSSPTSHHGPRLDRFVGLCCDPQASPGRTASYQSRSSRRARSACAGAACHLGARPRLPPPARHRCRVGSGHRSSRAGSRAARRRSRPATGRRPAPARGSAGSGSRARDGRSPSHRSARSGCAGRRTRCRSRRSPRSAELRDARSSRRWVGSRRTPLLDDVLARTSAARGAARRSRSGSGVARATSTSAVHVARLTRLLQEPRPRAARSRPDLDRGRRRGAPVEVDHQVGVVARRLARRQRRGPRSVGGMPASSNGRAGGDRIDLHRVEPAARGSTRRSPTPPGPERIAAELRAQVHVRADPVADRTAEQLEQRHARAPWP